MMCVQASRAQMQLRPYIFFVNYFSFSLLNYLVDDILKYITIALLVPKKLVAHDIEFFLPGSCIQHTQKLRKIK
jgi:hypothetical protein